MRHIFTLTALAALLAIAAGCSRLSPEARRIAGNYYIDEVSLRQPLMELGANGRCTIRKIEPGTVTFSVAGRWNVKHDSLMLRLDRRTLTVSEGDSALVGAVPEAMAMRILGADAMTLTVERDSIPYTYHRRATAR